MASGNECRLTAAYNFLRSNVQAPSVSFKLIFTLTYEQETAVGFVGEFRARPNVNMSECSVKDICSLSPTKLVINTWRIMKVLAVSPLYLS